MEMMREERALSEFERQLRIGDRDRSADRMFCCGRAPPLFIAHRAIEQHGLWLLHLVLKRRDQKHSQKCRTDGSELWSTAFLRTALQLPRWAYTESRSLL